MPWSKKSLECPEIKARDKEIKRKSKEKWRANNPGAWRKENLTLEQIENRNAAARKHRLKKNYSLTPEQFIEMLNKQKGKCAICGKHAAYEKKGLNIDHNHETGEVRELLCTACNRALGLLKEDTAIMRKMIAYVGRHIRRDRTQ